MNDESERFAVYLPKDDEGGLVANELNVWLDGRESLHSGKKISVSWFFATNTSFRSSIEDAVDYCAQGEDTLLLDSLEIFDGKLKNIRHHMLLSLIASILSAKENVSIIIRNVPHINASNVNAIALDRAFLAKKNAQATKSRLQQLKAHGKKLGVRPENLSIVGKKGAERAKKLAADRAIKLRPILVELAEKEKSYRSIAKKLNEDNIPTPSKLRNSEAGSKAIWHASTVRN